MSKAKKSTPTNAAKTETRRNSKRGAVVAPVSARAGSKIALLIEKLRAGAGASLPEISDATGWQHHSIRGAISGHLKKKLNLKVASTKDSEGVRRYRIAG